MMKTNSEIEDIVNSVLTKYQKRGGSYKLFDDIMLEEGIVFREINSLNSDFVGALTKGNSGEKSYIFINRNIENVGRRHFTIAHELGHYFLSHQLKDNSIFCSNNDIAEKGSQHDPIEREANYFASCFLMS